MFQKTYTPSILPFRSTRNNGEVEKYYITNTHAAVIDRKIYDAVQEMLNRNKEKKTKKAKSKKYSLSGKIYCGYCGWAYKRRIQNKIAYWVCSHDGVAGQQCQTKPISEEVFFKTFVNFYIWSRSKNTMHP